MAVKLIHDHGRVPAIYFPAGKPKDGGTCEFATKVCLERCPSDVTTNGLERAIYSEFVTQSASALKERLLMELLDRNCLLLHWFVWGDCPVALTEKVAWIIKQLKEEEVIQCGFTRNVSLWRKVCQSPSSNSLRMALTVEDADRVLDYCDDGLVAVPNYEKGMVELFYGSSDKETGKHVEKDHVFYGCCGEQWMADKTIVEYESCADKIHEASCEKCFKHARGCFRLKKIQSSPDLPNKNTRV